MKKILYPLCAALFFLACSNHDKLSDDTPESDGSTLNPQNELDRYLDKYIATPYSIEIVYRYEDNKLINREYSYTPTQYDKAVQFVNVFKYLFVEPYVKITSTTFLKEHSFNMLILLGQPAFNSDGSKNVGLANVGRKVHLTEINNIQPNNIYWLNDNLLSTLYHENSHTLHQSIQYTTDYEKISLNDYQGGNCFSHWGSTRDYLKAGFITAYSSYDHDEDFVELLARYIVYYNASLDCGCATTNSSLDTDGDGFDDSLYTAWKAKFVNYGDITGYESASVWEEVLKEADVKIRDTETYTGKQKLEQKIAIMKKYLSETWNINLDEFRAEIRSRYPYVAGKTFDGVAVPAKDFSKLNND
jgi:hypothetical protein